MQKIFRNFVFCLFSGALPACSFMIISSLPPLNLRCVCGEFSILAQRSVVELETHPVNAEEYRFLTGGDLIRWTMDCPSAVTFGRDAAL